MGRIEKHLKNKELTKKDMYIYTLIKEHKVLTQRKISFLLGVDASGVCKSLKKLLEYRLVRENDTRPKEYISED